MDRGEITTRPIVASDAATVADLHTASWRSAYRGMLRDEYLDGDIATERRQVWTKRLETPVEANYGFIAEAEAAPVGFVFLLGSSDVRWGTLVDNLHVVSGMKGRGIGRRLLEAAAHETLRRFPADPVYLYVFEQNQAARRFYASIGGREVERGIVEPPGGGSQVHWRVAWDDAQQLLASVRDQSGAGVSKGDSMAMAPQQCPKCNGRMEQGFILDNTYGARVVSHWASGAPLKSFWSGTKAPQGEVVPIGTYRCAACGFLEMYARPEFAAT